MSCSGTWPGGLMFQGRGNTELRLPTDDDDTEPGEPGLVALVRCDVTAGACERAAQSPQGLVELPS